MLFADFVLLGALTSSSLALYIPSIQDAQKLLAQAPLHSSTALETWLQDEENISVDRLLANIAPFGRNAQGAAAGTVLASPSREHPNYYYQWIRDAAITMSTVIDLYNSDPSSYQSTDVILPTLESYAELSRRIQRTSNPSGDFTWPDLSGLGEPKFEVDGSPFTGNWGRPQRDGPALRASALMAYMQAYNTTHPGLWQSSNDDWFQNLYKAELPAHSVIKADLEYTARHWPDSGFDVWEEVQGRHFFTGMAQLRALRQGSNLAQLFQDPGAAAYYQVEADKLEQSMRKDFWDEEGGYIRATRGSDAEWQRSGMDCSVLLGSLHGQAADQTWPAVFPPHDDAVLASLLKLVTDQRDRFPVNAGSQDADPLRGVGIGRYPEDMYDGYEAKPAGGNPWFLCTSSVSEILYRTAAHLNQTGRLDFSSRGASFWNALVCGGKPASSHCPLPASKSSYSYTAADDTNVFETALERLVQVGDSFLDVVKTHANADGALSEQFDRYHGFERGATDLTWSYGAFLQAVRARKDVV
ncbi:glucoamylase I precursor [Phyllosticta capitalensis]